MSSQRTTIVKVMPVGVASGPARGWSNRVLAEQIVHSAGQLSVHHGHQAIRDIRDRHAHAQRVAVFAENDLVTPDLMAVGLIAATALSLDVPAASPKSAAPFKNARRSISVPSASGKKKSRKPADANA